MPDILDFGKHTFHVWAAFGLTVVVLVANIFAARHSLAERAKHARRRLSGSAANAGGKP